ncbi:MAG: sulfurtransferase [Deltaproteobacteria bacterium]|nr:MAG: sulfurtransferase [Deltaproteobacteria bacterium]
MSAPFLLGADPWWLYILIGMGFGIALEASGFGDSRKIAGQFYFRENTVMKVMFTAIVVCMLLLHLFAALGIIDLELVFINPTYLWPGIVGGLLMGVGFIIGGYCPGTSVVSMATGKVDGALFFLGIGTGAWLFGETVPLWEPWWHSSYLGRFTLYDWLGVDAGVVVIAVVLLAIAFFTVAELIRSKAYGVPFKIKPLHAGYASAGLVVAVAVALIGQPNLEKRWEFVAERHLPRLQKGEVAVEPAELMDLMHKDTVKLVVLDVRPEADWNVFHLADARHLPLESFESARKQLEAFGGDTVVVAVSNGERLAKRAWQLLVAAGVPNAYYLQGGLNNWLEHYGQGLEKIKVEDEEKLAFKFRSAVGANHPAANPELHHGAKLSYKPKVKLRKRIKAAGGCG